MKIFLWQDKVTSTECKAFINSLWLHCIGKRYLSCTYAECMQIHILFQDGKTGVNPKKLEYIMEHSDISVTLNTYTHVGFEDAESELKRVVGK